jgi:Fe-S-cluster-containing dehydrogenase component
MNLDRRSFLKAAAAAGAAGAAPRASAATSARPAAGARGVLVDTTLCVGCRACEAACSERNGLPEPSGAGDARALDRRRDMSPEAFTVVNRGQRLGRDGSPRFAKTQCLHCVEPACASACPVRALEKRPSGPVAYDASLCIGCRYCMVACPFGVPKYEYAKAVPYVRKCDFCLARQEKGEAPACASVCPSGALLFGDRAELLEVARTRIYQSPERYIHHVYGEREAGGTSWLYIGDVPFESLGLRADVGEQPYPSLTAAALSGVPFVMTLVPPLLMAIHSFARARDGAPALGGTEAGHE